jgi:hypothetical protein
MCFELFYFFFYESSQYQVLTKQGSKSRISFWLQRGRMWCEGFVMGDCQILTPRYSRYCGSSPKQMFGFVGQVLSWLLNCQSRWCWETWGYGLYCRHAKVDVAQWWLWQSSEQWCTTSPCTLSLSDIESRNCLCMIWEDREFLWQLQIPRWNTTF